MWIRLQRESIISEVFRVLKPRGYFFSRLFIESEEFPKEIDINKVKAPTWGFTLKDIFDLFSEKFEILKIKISFYYTCFFVWMQRKDKALKENYSIKKIRKLIEFDYTKY